MMFEHINMVINNSENTHGYINYALSSVICASSESTYAGKTFPCTRLIDGISDNDTMDSMWANATSDFAPWVILELKKAISIKKIMIYHNKIFPVDSYVICGSNDKCIWTNLIIITNNNKNITIHNLNSIPYKFYKIEFTKPSSSDNAARLHEIELWG